MRERNIKFRVFVFLFLLSLQAGTVWAILQPRQETLPPQQLRLNDLSAFQAPHSNWKIAGNVFADIRHEQAMQAAPGKGILVNLSDDKNRGHLFTKFDHGDLDIEMDVMMPRGSNSGIYLQGRYEVQLFDSWGKEVVKYADMGGIYQRTDSVTNKGYEGSAPRLNACKAPGLWQKLKIIFRAPDFDQHGRKTGNARFVKVYLNGVIVQENVEVTGPTRSAAFQDEKAAGPLMIQGNHGRVAFRNISYKRYDRQKVRISDLSMREFKTPGDSIKGKALNQPIRTLKVDSLSRRLATQPDVFMMVYNGRLEFPRSGTYAFGMQTGGGGMLLIGGDTILHHDGVHGFDQKVFGHYKTRAGAFPFTLIYNKPIQWREGLALYAEGPGMETHPLHAPGSVFTEPGVDPILIQVDGKEAVIQRTFMDSPGGKLTHCLSVGTPRGIHYTLNLADGNLFQVWDGRFLDVTPMWHRRGNQQVGIPLGPVIRFDDDAPLMVPGTPGPSLKFLDYVLDSSGYPEIRYVSGDTKLSDKLVPAPDRRGLTRTIRITGTGPAYYKLALGTTIEKMPDGSFAVNDKEYYLMLDTSELQPEIKKVGKGQALLLRNNGPKPYEFRYTMFW